MSWLFSQALAEEYLEDICLDGEQSVQSNGSNTQQAYCAPDKMTDFSRLSRFGMTYKPLMENLGQELLTLYLEDFHAKTLAQQEKAQELKETEAECGNKCQESFAKLNHDMSMWKTPQCLLQEELMLSLKTWPQWGSMRNGECFQQPKLEHHTLEKEFGLLPNGINFFHTPCTTGIDGGSNSRKALKKRIEMLPTPQASDHITKKTSSSWKAKGAINYCLSNPEIQAKWPTPQASDCRDRGNMSNPSIQRRQEMGKQLNLSMVVHPTSGKLNPMWVEWLMGWPIGWTDLKPLEMDKSHFVQQQPGDC